MDLLLAFATPFLALGMAACSSFTPTANTTPTIDSTGQVVSSTTAAERVAACETRHGLSSAAERRMVGQGGVGTTQQYSSCTWPPAAGADPDGFAHVQAVTVEGPGRWVDGDVDMSSAGGANTRDQITGTCIHFALTYDYGHMGAVQHLPIFTADRGLVTSIDSPGALWTPDAADLRGWTFYPSRDEVNVLRNDNYALMGAHCT